LGESVKVRSSAEVVSVRKLALLAMAVVLVGLVGVQVAAQCGCSQPAPSTGTPSCYTAYWAGVDVSFKLVVPLEYFMQSPVPATPLITGWRVEQLDGTIVYQKQFPDLPKGHYLVMTWNQKNTQGHPAAPGFYRLVVQTTTAGEFSSVVKVVAPPGPCSWCCGCSRLVSHECCPTYCSPYVKTLPASSAGVPGTFSISIQISLPSSGGSCSCP
jgi:hypothetical protein